MVRALVLDIDVDLKYFSNLLRQQRIRHRISEESGSQVIWVVDDEQAALVQQLFDSHGAAEGEQVENNTEVPGQAAASTDSDGYNRSSISISPIARLVAVIYTAPVTMTLIFLCAIVALVTGIGSRPLRVEFLFFPLLPYDSLIALLSGITNPLIFLQTLGPMLLHFGELHIVFNLLWLWYFGRQLETVQSSWMFLLLVTVTSFAGNVMQYLSSQATNFGGMSGVVYGLVGYTWILHNFVPGKRMMLNNSMFGVFVVALVLMEVVASSFIATAAHVGGLLSGVALGLIVVIYTRLQSPMMH